MQYLPEYCSAVMEFLCKTALRFFPVKLLQSSMTCQRIQKVTVKGKSCFLIHIHGKLLIRIHQPIQIPQHIRTEKYRSGINIHFPAFIYRSVILQGFYRLLVQKFTYIPFCVHVKYTMVFSGFHVLLKRNGGRSGSRRINLQWIEQKQHIAGQHQHTVLHPCRDTAHANHKFIKECRTFTIGKLPRHRRKQFSQRAVLRHTFAVASRMYA